MRLIVATRSSNTLSSGKIIKEMPDSVASGTHCIQVAHTHISSQKKKYRIKNKFMCGQVGNGKTFHSTRTWLFE